MLPKDCDEFPWVVINVSSPIVCINMYWFMYKPDDTHPKKL